MCVCEGGTHSQCVCVRGVHTVVCVCQCVCVRGYTQSVCVCVRGGGTHSSVESVCVRGVHLLGLYHHTHSSGSHCTQNGLSYLLGESFLYCTHTLTCRQGGYTQELLTL